MIKSFPIISIIGRTNVGKSSLFNKIIGKRISIVHDSSGVTRDSVRALFTWRGRTFTLLDCGGLEFCKDDLISSQIEIQVNYALDVSDLVLFVVDAKSGVLPIDIDISNLLRRKNKKVIVCVNKCDNPGDDSKLYDFYSLAFGDVIPISSVHGHGTGDLLDLICERIPDDSVDIEDNSIKISIIGKPNVGKSSLVNRLCNRERCIVSCISGTTRDAVDVKVRYNETDYTLVDTAGIRRKNNVKDTIEKYSNFRSYDSASSSDVCLIVIDASEGITSQDVKIAGISKNFCKPCIILVNKWDKLEANPDNVINFNKKIRELFQFVSYAPVIYISAKTGKNCDKIFPKVKQVYENANRRISTSNLNNFLERAIFRVPPPAIKGKQLKIYYMTQSSTLPPTFVFFVNKAKLFHFSYRRYLENRIREEFDFSGSSLKFVIRQKGENCKI